MPTPLPLLSPFAAFQAIPLAGAPRRPATIVPVLGRPPRVTSGTIGCQMNDADTRCSPSASRRSASYRTPPWTMADLAVLITCARCGRTRSRGLREVPRPDRVEAGAPGRAVAMTGCMAVEHGPRSSASFPSSTTSSTCATATASSRGLQSVHGTDLDGPCRCPPRPSARLRLGDGRLQHEMCNLLHRPLCPRPGDEPPGGRDRGGRPPFWWSGGARGDPPRPERQLLLTTRDRRRPCRSCWPPSTASPGSGGCASLTSHPRNALPGLFEAMRRPPHRLRAAPPARPGRRTTSCSAGMRRMYTVDEYLAKIASARATVPALALTTDIIVGFSAETEAEFLGTEQLLRTVRFDVVHLQAYSSGPAPPPPGGPTTCRSRRRRGGSIISSSSSATSHCSATSPWSVSGSRSWSNRRLTTGARSVAPARARSPCCPRAPPCRGALRGDVRTANAWQLAADVEAAAA